MPLARPFAAAALALLVAGPALAAYPDAAVEALQMPAWLERGGSRVPLAPGMTLRPGDSLTTGRGARARLRLADGSMVKLGENARFGIAGLAQASPAEAAFRATLDVVEGAFRFTTTLLHRYRGRRDVQVRFSTVTAGIRGTDLWGKSTIDGDVVALLEGKIVLTRGVDPPVVMEQPLTLYQAPRVGAAAPLQLLSSDQLARFAAETEIEPGAGAAQPDGRWRVVAAVTSDAGEAGAVHDRLREAGYAAAVRPVVTGGERVWHVQVGALASEADAATLATRLRAELGLSSAMPARR
jgi:hypothetical protein